MTAICNTAIHLCRIRVTRISALGEPVAGPHNVIVSDKPLKLAVKTVVEAGTDKTLVGGCDCLVATYRGPDKLKRFDLELDTADLDAAMLEMLTGADAIIDANTGFPIGDWWPSNLSCSDPAQPDVCFEGWQTAWDNDHQAAAPYQYVHWIWPSTSWQIGDHTLENEFTQPKLTGFSRGNDAWGLGIFGDLPEAAGPLGGWFFTDEIPAASCGYQSWAIT